MKQRLESDPAFRQRVINANIPLLSNRVQQQVNARTAQAAEQLRQQGGQILSNIGNSSTVQWLRSFVPSGGNQPAGQPGVSPSPMPGP